MLAVIAETPGPIDTVVIRDVPEPGELRAGEVVVRMLVSTFNPSDAVTVSGAYASRTAFPLVPGFEGVGIIDRIGPGVPTSALGQRVLPIGSPGAWQEYKRIDHSWCIPVPDDIPTDVACFAYINPLTASLMVERFSWCAVCACRRCYDHHCWSPENPIGTAGHRNGDGRADVGNGGRR